MKRKSGGYAMAWLAASLFTAVMTQSISAQAPAQGAFGSAGKESDTFDTGRGRLEVVFLGHASLVFAYEDKLIYIDPVKQYGDFAAFPKAGLILVTHEHGDHLDAATIAALKTDKTAIILNESSRKKLGGGNALAHGEALEWGGVAIEAVPAYNVSAGRTNYHPKERKDNGYILGIGNLRIYVAGDTEPIPEMSGLGRIDIAFLPMNLPFTMTPEQVAEAACVIRPRILYPYHFGNTDTAKILKLLEGETGIEVRMRKLQ